MSGLTIVFGTAGFTAGNNYPTPADAKVVLDIVYENGVRHLDTAQLYGDSEGFLGAVNAGDRFNLDTKAKGGFDPSDSLEPDNLYKKTHASIEKLKVKQVDIFYIHAPDERYPPSVWLPVIDKLYKEGLFKRLGVSNFHAEQVREVYDLAKAKDYILPSVFQGNYSPVTRRQETDLFPLLRELNMSFYAYSPLAGGFLAKTKKGLLDGAKYGRFANDGSVLSAMYQGMYLKPTLLDALDEWELAAKEEGVSQAELAYRWVSYHSPLKPENGDAIIFGARNTGQAVETITGLKKGPLKASVVAKIDEVWEKVKDEAPLDNYNSFAKSALAG